MRKLFLFFALFGGCLHALVAEPLLNAVVLDRFELAGDLSSGHASFILTATARVDSHHGASLGVLEGPVALTRLDPGKKWRIRENEGRFVAEFEHAGKYPLVLKFDAAVQVTNGWSEVAFRVAPGALQGIRLRGLPANTQLEFQGGARPERRGDDFTCVLPGDGTVKFRWKEAQPEGEGKLFYSAEMLSQVSVSPGLLRQIALFDFKVMQGELNSLSLRLVGPGEITRVQGEQVLSWNVETVPGSAERRLIVHFNQGQKNQFSLQVQTQSPLAAFPQTADVLRLQPERATRFAGFFRVVNDGAVRLEVAQAAGLSQVSPEQFPETDVTRAQMSPQGAQRFVYRFSSPDFALRIQADQILPDLAVSEILSYHLGETELSIDAEFEVDIREAPLRELNVLVPRGYAVARLTVAGLSDYFLVDAAGQDQAELRLVFGQPASGRQLIQFRLERARPVAETWALPRLEIPRAKSVRGHLAIAADAGFRLTPERAGGLTEIAAAFFPRKMAGIQSAFRLSEPGWQAAVRIERLPQAIQADVLHLFSIGEGIAYGSSLITYSISGAPLSVFKLELSDEYANVEFTGKDIRNWQKIKGGYQVQLHTPVSGSYTLLASYERPFKPQGETLTFTGARPSDARSEQGHTIIISAYQFQVTPAQVSEGLIRLEPGEVPSEYRLFFDSPILAAYRYSARPFNLSLALSPLIQGDSLSLVVDRACLSTKISKEGQIVTDARYFIKNRGNPHLRLSVPAGARLWSATVNGNPVVPVADGNSNLIPLPAGGGSNSLTTLDIKIASASRDPRRLQLFTPSVQAPVLLAEWTLLPDTEQKLSYVTGDLAPVGDAADDSGFGQLLRTVSRSDRGQIFSSLFGAAVLVFLGFMAWTWAKGAAYRWSPRHIAGLFAGGLSLVFAAMLLVSFAELVRQNRAVLGGSLDFVAPVQQAGSGLNLTISNVAEGFSVVALLQSAWPAFFVLPLWILAWLTPKSWLKIMATSLGWVTLAWALLRVTNSGVGFIVLLAVLVTVFAAVPLFMRAWRLPMERGALLASKPGPSAATAAVAFLVCFGFMTHKATAGSRSHTPVRPPDNIVAQAVTQQIQVDDKFATAVAHIRWDALKGQRLPLLYSPAVLTRIHFPADALKLQPIMGEMATNAPMNQPLGAQELYANKSEVFEVEFEYQLRLAKRQSEVGFFLPMKSGLVNQLTLVISNLDVEVTSPQAVSLRREVIGSNTVATISLSAAENVWVGWKPRVRDVAQERPVFFADFSQLYVPGAGVIEGQHLASLRVAHGELSELIFDVPAGATITDVVEPEHAIPGANQAKPSIVSVWRFDPDARKLKVTLSPAQGRPLTFLIKSQLAVGPLPLTQSVGLLSVEGAADQLGLIGLATGSDVQLDSVDAGNLSPINLEDFPPNLITNVQSQVVGATLRRAFRYANPASLIALQASPVQPDIRVESQDTVSLGEDRVVLAANATINIARAGIFRLSFALPQTFDVESISGAALSHWTELKTETNRIVTLHLNGKTEGIQQFAISLAASGVRATNGWLVPQLVFREAAKHTGTLLLVPEQGLRLQVAASDGLSQLDPQKAGIRQKGVLAFRVLQPSRGLSLNLERVDPWIQVTSLEHVTVGEAQTKILANFHYQIENAAVKTFHLSIPTNAEGVQITGEQISDFLPLAGSLTNGVQSWEVKLNRRVVGSFQLQVSYTMPVAQNARLVSLRGMVATGVNLHRGFVTVQSSGRLQVNVSASPAALQPAEWQSIPRNLQQGLPANSANFTYRLVEPDFELPLELQRYQAAQLLPGRVISVNLHSVVSDDGVMLTQATLEMVPGEKRLLRMTLPADAHFWFAFVNEAGVWPWREQDQILIPLEQQTLGSKRVSVEVFYTSRVGQPRSGLRLNLAGPRFDLPLENISWQIGVSDKWTLKKWNGTLQLASQELLPQSSVLDLKTYLQGETVQQQARTRQAEDFLTAANTALAQGNPQQARRAFQSAFGLSTHDTAFNEDARVQLHNIKLQEALVGLNVRQAATAGESGSLPAKIRELRDRKEVGYTQQDAKDLIEKNSSDENAAFMRLAERLIQQQDAAVTTPAALHATVPQQGRILTFKRSILVTPWAPLNIQIQASNLVASSGLLRLGFLGATLLFVIGITWAGRHYSFQPAAR